MNLDRLYQILQETSVQFRKGEKIEGNHIYDMPHKSKANDRIEKVDCHFVTVGVDKTRGEIFKDELVDILKDWPSEAWGSPIPKLEEGPNYIHVGGVIGDQGAAFQLFALGKVLGFWDIITPAKLGITGNIADQMAGVGFVAIDGFKIPNS